MACSSSDDDDFVVVTSAPREVSPMTINGLVTADLTSYDTISEFPDFMSVNNLQVIRMSTNELQSLPEEFCRMRYIKELYLFGDRIRQGHGLSSLPNNFGNLKTLEVLNLERNKLETFPLQICELSNLKKLYLNSCEITSIPPAIAQLVNLTDVDLSYNDLSQGFPSQFFDLPRLKQLYLIGCNLENLPPEIGRLQQLEGLRLNENMLESFPEELYTMRHLKKLYAVRNCISSLSPSILGLESLEMLLLMENNITTLPREISKLQNLQYLDVFDNKLTCLPESITELGSSTQMIFSGNTYLQMPPLSVCNKGMDSIRGFFESMTKSRAVHSDRLKIVLLGESGAGKTSLAHALVHCKSIQTTNDSTVGVVIHQWQIEPDGLEAQIVDCAGQRHYQLTHPFFLSEEALHIVVINLETYQKTSSSFDANAGDWIKWVTARLLKPRIMIVLTHRDECNDDDVQDKCCDIMARVNDLELTEVKRLEVEMQVIKSHSRCDWRLSQELKKLEWQRNNRPVISSVLLFPGAEDGVKSVKTSIGMLPVSSKRELVGMIELRAEIKRVAKNNDLFPSVGRELPESWIDLENAIKDYRNNIKPPNVPCMTLQEFETFAQKNSGLSGIGLRSALNYLDSVGEVKFYNNIPGIECSVFLDLCWLGKLVKLLFRHDHKDSLKFQESFYEFRMEKILFQQCASQLKESGVLSLLLLRCIWQELCLSDDTFKQMVKALQHFGLACELPSKDDDDHQLFIPWFLHSGSCPEDWPDVPDDDLVEIKLVFAMCRYLPGGLFDRLRIRCYSLAVDADNWQDGMLVHMGGDLMILIQITDPQSEPTIVISGRAPKECLRELWLALLPVIQETEALLNEWSRLVYHTYTVCPKCVSNNAVEPGYFSCDWVKRRSPASLRCKKSTMMRRHEVDVDLLVPPQDLHQGSWSISEDVPEALLSCLSTQIPRHWKPLAFCLSFSQNQIDNIDANHADVSEKANRMLQDWRAREGRNAKRSTLISSLKSVDKSDVIEMVKMYRGNTV